MDKNFLPPHISVGEKNSFAMMTLKERKPSIIDQVIEANNLMDKHKEALLALKCEMTRGAIIDPFRDPSQKIDALEQETVQVWKQAIAPHVGKSWLCIPFYFAEAFFYLRILIAIGYYDFQSPFFMKDPFQPFKDRELFSEDGAIDTARTISNVSETIRDPSRLIKYLLCSSLWGNRVDLSLKHVADRSRNKVISEQGNNLLIDHSQKLIQLIDESNRIDVILDNTGHELVCDLITLWNFLTSSPSKSIHLHVKKYPFYVSDAMAKDVYITITALINDRDKTLSGIGQDLHTFVEKERLFIHENFFWNTPLHFNDFTGEIMRELSCSDIVILKGDANYRRLLSDRKWNPWDKMKEITSYFPVSFAVLRTMKSEIVVDLDKILVAKLSQDDPQWMVNGKRGIIQVVEQIYEDSPNNFYSN